MSPVELSFGGGAFMSEEIFGPVEEMKEAISILQAEGIKYIDTAALYGESEKFLGDLGASKTHTIDTKYPGGFAGTSSKEKIIASANESLKKLQTNQVCFFPPTPTYSNKSNEQV